MNTIMSITSTNSLMEKSFFARSYTDEHDSAHFLNAEKAGRSRLLTRKDLDSPLFLEAQAYLRQAGKTVLSWLSGKGNGYEPLSDSNINTRKGDD